MVVLPVEHFLAVSSQIKTFPTRNIFFMIVFFLKELNGLSSTEHTHTTGSDAVCLVETGFKHCWGPAAPSAGWVWPVSEDGRRLTVGEERPAVGTH